MPRPPERGSFAGCSETDQIRKRGKSYASPVGLCRSGVLEIWKLDSTEKMTSALTEPRRVALPRPFHQCSCAIASIDPGPLAFARATSTPALAKNAATVRSTLPVPMMLRKWFQVHFRERVHVNPAPFWSPGFSVFDFEPPNIALGWRAEHARVFTAELRSAFVANVVRGRFGVGGTRDHQLSRLQQA